MIVSGHQPTYLPWLGLFHKISLCDVFVYMDTVQFLSGDWNNRNKIRLPQGSMWLTVPIDKALSKSKQLNDIVMQGFQNPADKEFWQKKHWLSIESNYKKAKYFNDYANELEEIYLNKVWEKLIDLCWAQFQLFLRWLELDHIRIVRMTEYSFSGKKDELVLDHCLKLSGDSVVFGTQGENYVNLDLFTNHKIKVYFQNYQHPTYEQRFTGFEPYLSIVDLIFNHGKQSKEILLSGNITKELLLTNKHWVN